MAGASKEQGEAWRTMIGLARGRFSARSFAIFSSLVTGWVLAPGRRSVTGMICAGDPEGRRAHDAYHRFFRASKWSTNALWRPLVVHMVALLCPGGTILLDLDDTLYKKSGRKIDGAGTFRDAVRSTCNKVVYATGLNLVVVTLRVAPPWGGMPVGVPVGVRLHRKGGPTTTELAAEILVELAGWLPDRCFSLCADGAYATLAGRRLPRTTVTSRMRRDAALYEPAPPRTGRRGRPRTKGARLATPAAMAGGLANDAFSALAVAWCADGPRISSSGRLRCCGTRWTRGASCSSSSCVIQRASWAMTCSSPPISTRLRAQSLPPMPVAFDRVRQP